jgi:DNA-binding transcriptional regulator GbsR (MarR family)
MTSRTARPPTGDDHAPHAVDADALARFVERFAVVLTEAGWPRMPARVFACLLADERGELTARQLAARLRVSPAAISGAVRYLQQISLVTRAREPGARTDHYRLEDNVWYESIVHRTAELRRWEDGLAAGVEVVGASTAAGHRLEESRAFFAFLRGELPRLLERWRAQQARG